ncbi:MAG: BACON domain-containing protein [Nitrospiraceae bacterium]
MTFTAMEAGSNPKNQTLNITNTGGGTLSWTVTENATWLSLDPTSGTTTTETDIITVNVNIAGLSSNTYSAMITLSTVGAPAAQQIPVTLILSAPSPTFGQNPESLTFPGMEGGANPTTQTISIRNTGKGTLSWNASENADWLTLSPASGTTTTETDSISVSVNAAGLKTNTYTTTITLTDPTASNNPQEIPVTLALTAPQSGVVSLSWDPNAESDLAGYKIYFGTASGSYASPVDVGNVTTFKLINLLRGKIYYFAVTAYDKSGNESGYSNEVSKSLP